MDRSTMFGVFGRQPPKASAREVALEDENSALKAEVAALRRRLGEDKGPGKAATPKTARPRAETQGGAPATGTKRARDGDGDERPKKSYQQRQYEKKLAKMPAWEQALHEGKTEFPRFTVPEPGPPVEQIDRDDDERKAERKAFAEKMKDDMRKSKEQFQKRWEETASLRPFRHQDLAADDEAKRRDARVWYESLKADYLKSECRALGLYVKGNKSELYKRIAGWARYGVNHHGWGDGVCQTRTICGAEATYCVTTDEFPRVDATFWKKPRNGFISYPSDDGEDSDDVSDEAEQRRRDWRIAHGDSPRDSQELYEFRRAKFERARRPALEFNSIAARLQYPLDE